MLSGYVENETRRRFRLAQAERCQAFTDKQLRPSLWRRILERITNGHA